MFAIRFSRSVLLLFVVLLMALLVGCDDILAPSARSVCVSGYNQYERNIHKFWLDNENKAGCWGNPSGREEGYVYGGGGGHVCGCRVTPGSEVSLNWEFVQTPEDFDAKIPAEEHALIVKVPDLEPSWSPEYLRIYFFNNGTAQLQWGEDFSTPKLVPPGEGSRNE